MSQNLLSAAVVIGTLRVKKRCLSGGWGEEEGEIIIKNIAASGLSKII